MTTLKAMVRKPRTDGLYSVYIRIVHNRKPGYIKTDKIVDANHVSNGEITDPVVNEFCAMIDILPHLFLGLKYFSMILPATIGSWPVVHPAAHPTVPKRWWV